MGLWVRSSVGSSKCLLNTRSKVRILPDSPFPLCIYMRIIKLNNSKIKHTIEIVISRNSGLIKLPLGSLTCSTSGTTIKIGKQYYLRDLAAGIWRSINEDKAKQLL